MIKVCVPFTLKGYCLILEFCACFRMAVQQSQAPSCPGLPLLRLEVCAAVPTFHAVLASNSGFHCVTSTLLTEPFLQPMFQKFLVPVCYQAQYWVPKIQRKQILELRIQTGQRAPW